MGSIPEDPKNQSDIESGGLSLYSAEEDERPQFLAFARRMVEYLKNVGFPEIERLRRAPGGQATTNASETEQHNLGLRWVRLENGQVVALILNTERTWRGYKDVAVLNSEQAHRWLVGSHAERAIISAVTVMAIDDMNVPKSKGIRKPINVGLLSKALDCIRTPLTKSAREHARDTSKKTRDRADMLNDPPKWEEDNERTLEFLANLQIPSLEYVLALLRYKRPEFDTYPREQQVELVKRACDHVNEVVESARKLTEFLEYGTPKGLPTKAVERNKDVRAAVLRDVAGLNYREIGEELDVPLPPNFETKGEHGTVRKMADRGKDFLESVLSKDRWRQEVEAKKADAARFNSQSEDDKAVERWAEFLGVSLDEARKHYLQEKNEYEEEARRLRGSD